MPPTPSIPDLPSHAPPRTSIALIAASLFGFLVFVFLSIHKRPSQRARTTSSPPVTNKKPSAKHRPKLWEVCLDEDHLDGASHDWQVSHIPYPHEMNVSCDACLHNSLSPHGRTIVWGGGCPPAAHHTPCLTRSLCQSPKRVSTILCQHHPRLPHYQYPIIALLMLLFW